jgi:hypothetical protein
VAEELKIRLAQLRAANANGGMYDLRRLPADEQQRRDKLLALDRYGRYVYTVNAGLLRTPHLVPTEEDLLAFPAGAASLLWCSQLWFHPEQHPDQFLQTTLEDHNTAIQRLIDHPDQRERIDDRYVIYLRCLHCQSRHHALQDPAETDDSARG